MNRELLPQASAFSFPDVLYERDGHKQQQGEMERVFPRYFGDLVCEWDPSFDAQGNVRYFWGEDVGAHDVEVQSSAGFNPSCPERARLREVLDVVFDAKTLTPDLQPVRRLVVALVGSSCRHKLHERSPPVLGKHTCARVLAGMSDVLLRLSTVASTSWSLQAHAP